jgi:hypothetical protein
LSRSDRIGPQSLKKVLIRAKEKKVSKNANFYAELKKLQISLPRKRNQQKVKEICCFPIYTHAHKIGWVQLFCINTF